ncbi:glyoxalase/bleomycin resistance/extradiol dioxygenase family protein [Mammaliicoccus sp. Dog046]|uniref:VOC family protein n=1 Tax=Mammaliicoccus sp. Dog046 TaxID=3034233 RepID=UPI002B25AEA4|nr:glyoxalase/bleomycin resistance/extradiol dioxygenase family protein [Mammaliicoccus sp. Dog046]WQK86156.1 glyoxalase/bleomycin resistance/extradiol dioxygenase family protein [Mammaliicoccus sp. Dog046]
MVEVITYFNFKNSIEALKFYEEKLGATDIMRVAGNDELFKDAPPEFQMPESFTMNASFKILGKLFLCSDTWENKDIDNEGAQVCFQFDYNNEEDKAAIVDLFEKAKSAGCEMQMPLSEVEWSPMFGSFNDPFGVTWMANAVSE